MRRIALLVAALAVTFGLTGCHGGAHRQNILTSDAEIDANVPTSGSQFTALQTECNGDRVFPDSQSSAENAWQNTLADTNILACAVLAVRLDEGVNDSLAATYQSRVTTALAAYASDGPNQRKVLGTARSLAPMVAAADLVDYYNTTLQQTLHDQLTVSHDIGVCSSTLVGVAHCSGENWGDNARASVVAIEWFLNAPDSLYEDDYTDDLVTETAIFNEYTGESNSGPVSLNYDDGAEWRPAGAEPRGINAAGLTMCSGNVAVGGVRSNDQARDPGTGPDCTTNTAGQYNENYAYGGFQGNVMEWILLQRLGYVDDLVGNDAITRALNWLNTQNAYPPEADDAWVIPAVNEYRNLGGFGFTEQACETDHPGKNMSCNVAKAIW